MSSVSVGHSLAAPQQGEQSSPGDTSWNQLQPTHGCANHSREEGRCSSQEGKPRRSGQDQAQGQANPSLEETSHSSFPCSLVPGYSAGPEHGHQTPWSRVEECVGAQTPLTL